MLTNKEMVWLEKNADKYSTNMKKFILFMYRINGYKGEPEDYADVADSVNVDVKRHFHDRVFKDHPQPEGKE